MIGRWDTWLYMPWRYQWSIGTGDAGGQFCREFAHQRRIYGSWRRAAGVAGSSGNSGSTTTTRRPRDSCISTGRIRARISPNTSAIRARCAAVPTARSRSTTRCSNGCRRSSPGMSTAQAKPHASRLCLGRRDLLGRVRRSAGLAIERRRRGVRGVAGALLRRLASRAAIRDARFHLAAAGDARCGTRLLAALGSRDLSGLGVGQFPRRIGDVRQPGGPRDPVRLRRAVSRRTCGAATTMPS